MRTGAAAVGGGDWEGCGGCLWVEKVQHRTRPTLAEEQRRLWPPCPRWGSIRGPDRLPCPVALVRSGPRRTAALEARAPVPGRHSAVFPRLAAFMASQLRPRVLEQLS